VKHQNVCTAPPDLRLNPAMFYRFSWPLRPVDKCNPKRFM
jgi:hypothetical protein